MNLKGNPFYLREEDIQWVEYTLESMTLEEKIGQLFCPIGYSTERQYLDHELLRWHIGGLFFRNGLSEEMRDTFAYAQAQSRIPLLIPSNLEAGGDGAAVDGTSFGKPMAAAAAGDKRHAYRLGMVSCEEGASIGINWAFAPIVDIDMNFHNPITNVRTFGSNPDVVSTYAKEYVRAAKECNVAACAKHFPGDGVDERDQHLLTSVNSLSIEQWEETYGAVYREMIDAGTPTIMAGHIAMPAYEEYFKNDQNDLCQTKYQNSYSDEIIPASLSKALLMKLLRAKLGFEGLIITDATPMVGFTAAMSRQTAVPLAIENGCDLFLFNKDLAEDYKFMLEGYQNGILSEKRLLEANRRILALKASLRLPEKQKHGRLVPEKSEVNVLQCEKHMRWSQELADESITLVKDTQQILPISCNKTKRILLEIIGDFPSNERVVGTIKEELEKHKFDVMVYEKEDFEKGVDNVSDFRKKYDLVIYIGNVENASNQTTNRLNWYTFWGQGNNVPWFAKEVPVIFISVANPYHLLDVPMLKTYINCYSNHECVLKTVVSKIVGESEFKGKSPIDPFCNRKELAY